MQDAQLIKPNNEHELLILWQQFIGGSALRQQQKGRIYIDKRGRDALWKEKHENKVLE